MKLIRAQVDGLVFLTLGILLFLAIGFSIERAPDGMLDDFKAIYYGVRCLLQHHNPYSPGEVQRVYLAETHANPADPIVAGKLQNITVNVYFPSTFLIAAPLALLPWGPAHLLWMAAVALSLIAAACGVWWMGAKDAPIFAGLCAGLLLADAFAMLWVGNAAGLIVGLCILAAVCFLQDRYIPLGILCLTASLMVKPHDAWLIWLYFLLAGERNRRRALSVLALTVSVSTAAAVWIWSVAPHWIQELRANLSLVSGPLGRDNPGPFALGTHTAGMIVDLQTVFSIFRDDARFYNSASYLVGGALIAIWAMVTLRAPATRANSLIALAAAVPLTLLPVYHRIYDTRLLLLTIPAAAILWRRGGLVRWGALALNGAAILLTGDIPLIVLVSVTDRFHLVPGSLGDILLLLLFGRPVPLLLLALAVFYLAVYVRELRRPETSGQAAV